MLEDLRPRRLREDPALAALVSATEPIYREHFNSTLMEELEETFEDAQVGFLVAPATDGEPAELLGFIVYRFWGPPLKAASIFRVAVPTKHRMFGYGRQLVQWFMEKARRQPRHQTNRVTLNAVPSAIAFYERLHFAPVLEDDDEMEVQADDATPRSMRMCYKLGRAFMPPKKR
jgi:ribosomal protein S18 acetylase RimI-like enzyme